MLALSLIPLTELRGLNVVRIAVPVRGHNLEELILPCALIGFPPLRPARTCQLSGSSESRQPPSASRPSGAASLASGTGRPNINGTPGAPHSGQVEITSTR